MLTPFTAPPEDYYQNNCIALIEFVCSHYAELLTEADLKLLHNFLHASETAQRLVARLLSRKPGVIRQSSCEYAEVGPLEPVLAELTKVGLVATEPDVPAEQLLERLKKSELADLFSNTTKSRTKAALTQQVLGNNSDQQIRQIIYATYHFVAIKSPTTWKKALFLYFGASSQDWSSFVLRDLGQVSFERVPLEAQWSSSTELEADLRVGRLSQLSHRLPESPALAADLVLALEPTLENRWQQRRRNRALLRVARFYERAQDFDAALNCYEMISIHPARERQVRILDKLGCREEVATKLTAIRQAPRSAEEEQFAQRFGTRNGGYQPATKEYRLSDYEGRVHGDQIEEIAGQILCADNQAQGSFHVENQFVRTLTGLMYWPIIFQPVSGAFTNPFQSAPNDLYHDEFLTNRALELAALETELADDAKMGAHLKRVCAEKVGRACDLVSWSMLNKLALDQILMHMPVAQIRTLTAFMIRNLHARRSGFPDLFVARADGYCLVEVKGPGDQLQPGQRVWLQRLAEMDIPSYVMRIK